MGDPLTYMSYPLGSYYESIDLIILVDKLQDLGFDYVGQVVIYDDISHSPSCKITIGYNPKFFESKTLFLRAGELIAEWKIKQYLNY